MNKRDELSSAIDGCSSDVVVLAAECACMCLLCLHRMRQLLGVHARQDGQLRLLERFLERLPRSVHVVLAGSNETSLDQIAQLADRITEYSTPTFAPKAAARTQEQPDRLSRLEEKVQQLTKTMQQFFLSGDPQKDEQ